MDYATLKLIWWGLVLFMMVGFIVMDGFDLGIAMLLPLVSKDDEDRRLVINSVGPVWEGNQVWLIAGAGALFAAWPLVYAAAFSALYVPFMFLLFGLFLRPVGFDYRSKLADPVWRRWWCTTRSAPAVAVTRRRPRRPEAFRPEGCPWVTPGAVFI